MLALHLVSNPLCLPLSGTDDIRRAAEDFMARHRGSTADAQAVGAVASAPGFAAMVAPPRAEQQQQSAAEQQEVVGIDWAAVSVRGAAAAPPAYKAATVPDLSANRSKRRRVQHAFTAVDAVRASALAGTIKPLVLCAPAGPAFAVGQVHAAVGGRSVLVMTNLCIFDEAAAGGANGWRR